MTLPTEPSLTKLTRSEQDQDGVIWYVGEYYELPGCVVYTTQQQDVARLLEEAKTAYLANLASTGQVIPVPDVETPGGLTMQSNASTPPDDPTEWRTTTDTPVAVPTRTEY